MIKESTTLTQEDMDEWRLTGVAKVIVDRALRATFCKSNNHDILIRFVLDEADLPLLTSSVHNRILSVLRRHYGFIVLISCDTYKSLKAKKIHAEKCQKTRAFNRLKTKVGEE